MSQRGAVILFALRHRGTGGDDGILLHVDHGVHFHQPVVALERDEVGGLIGNVQQQGEGGVVAHLLHLALGRSLGRSLCRARHRVEAGLLGALVAQDEADVGLVGGHRGDAGVHIHIVVNGDVVVPFGGQRHVPLAKDGVEKAVVVAAIVVVLLDDQVGGVDAVHPGGDLLIIRTLAGDGVHQHRAVDVGTAEQADGFDHAGADPVGGAVIVDLKHRIGEHHGGVLEPQQTVEVAAEMLGGGVFHALVQAYHLGVLGHHVNDQIGGQAVGTVGKPLDQIAVPQRGDPHRAVLVVDLGVGGQNLKLAHHVAQLAQLAAAQLGGRGSVQHGDLIIGDLLNILGKVACLNIQQFGVSIGPQRNPARHRTHQRNDNQRDGQKEGDGTLLAQKGEIAADALPLEPRSDDRADTVHGAQAQNKEIEILRMQVEGGQLQIKPHQPHRQRHPQIDEGAGNRVADGLAGFARGGVALLSKRHAVGKAVYPKGETGAI